MSVVTREWTTLEEHARADCVAYQHRGRNKQIQTCATTTHCDAFSMCSSPSLSPHAHIALHPRIPTWRVAGEIRTAPSKVATAQAGEAASMGKEKEAAALVDEAATAAEQAGQAAASAAVTAWLTSEEAEAEQDIVVEALGEVSHLCGDDSALVRRCTDV